MEVKNLLSKIQTEINQCLNSVDDNSLIMISDSIIHSNRIITIGAGRMGYSLKAFSMRLSHIGFNSFHLGDTNIPSYQSGDLIIIASGSGETKTILCLAEIAKKNGYKILTITHNNDSSIAKLSDEVVILNKVNSTQMMKTIYEQSTYILYDIICEHIVNKRKLNKNMIEKNHSVLE